MNGGNGNGNGNGNGIGSSKLQATITLQSSRGEVSLSVLVSNCYLARTVIYLEFRPVLSCKMSEEGDLQQHR